MKVAGIQFDIAWEFPSENLRRIRPLLAKAAENGSRLAVLPEMFATGFSMNVARLMDFSALIEKEVQSLAKEFGLFLVAGIACPLNNNATPLAGNHARIFSPGGELLADYQKIHPFSYGDEHLHYAAGSTLATAHVEGIRVTPVICYDLRFPEIFRAAALQTDLFLVLANWPASRRHAWRTLLTARAIENQAYVLGVNRLGSDGSGEYCGDSLLVDPFGEILDQAQAVETVITGEVDPTLLRMFRERFPALKDRRPEVYRQLEISPPSL